MDPFQEGPWSLGTRQQRPPLLIIHLSTLPPLLNSWLFILLQLLGLCLCGHQGLSAFTAISPQMLFALRCYNSVILDAILGQYLLKHSKDLFTRHGLYYSEVPMLVLVPFSPRGQRLCLPILL